MISGIGTEYGPLDGPEIEKDNLENFEEVDHRTFLHDLAEERNVSQPYIIKIENKTKKEQRVTIYGSNQNRHLSNFGAPKGVAVTSWLPGVTYGQILAQSETKPFRTEFLRVSSVNTQAINNPITVSYKDANGTMYRAPVIPLLDPYQQQSTIVDIRKTVTVDGSTDFTLDIPKKTTVHIYVYPSEILSLVALLKKAVIKVFRKPSITPRVPVIIKPSGSINSKPEPKLASVKKITRWMKVKWFFRNIFNSTTYTLSA
jgi:hypothetical protein